MIAPVEDHPRVLDDGLHGAKNGFGKMDRERTVAMASEEEETAGDGTPRFPWLHELSKKRWFIVIWTIIRIVLVLTFMYFFVCSLSLMSDAFRLIAGVKLGKIFRHNPLLQNPVIDLMVGALVTMAIHSSGTTTAIVISMTAANVMPVDNAIYILFGAEIGTSITNTMVSIGHIADRDDFRRAFSGATMHSVFNWITVLIFFPLECGTHMLRRCAELMVQDMQPKSNANADKEFLNAIIKPFTSKIIRLDKDVINDIATEKLNETNFTTMIKPSGDFLFVRTSISDTWVGVILLVCALTCLFCCLAGVAKTMNSMLASSFAKVLKRHINSDLPGRWKPLTGYIFILVGAIMTAIIQSSTVFTSTLTPMVGIGVISVERVFPLILGANIGTTLTNILGALAQEANVIKVAMTVAMFQVLFNVFGVALFYPIPFLRNIVIKTGKWLGRQTCRYRWFAFVYIFLLFVFLPLLGIGLSLAGEMVVYCVGIPLIILVLIITLINALQCQKPSLLPAKLRDWSWLPEPMHSLEPYDRWLSKMCCCCRRFTRNADVKATGGDENGDDSSGQTSQNSEVYTVCDNNNSKV